MLTVKRKIELAREAIGCRRIAQSKKEPNPGEAGTFPRISCRMALGIRLEGMLLSGLFCDVTKLAHLGPVTQPRMFRILNLTMLAADIQEALDILPRVTSSERTIYEKNARPASPPRSTGMCNQ